MGRIKIGNVRPTIEYLNQYFAPAGYGLGSVGGDDKWNGDANALTKQGWYRLESGTANGVGASASLRVDGYTETGLTQTAYTRTGFIMQRTCVDGVWGEWEWINPPMVPGVEYRTTERWIGKPVYTKLIDCGNMLNAEPKTIAHGCEAIIVVRCHGATNLGTTIPYRWNDYYLDVSADRTNILICTNADFSGQSCVVKLYYTKN